MSIEHILVLDRVVDRLTTMKAHFELDCGCKVSTATTIEEAESKIQANAPDLILASIAMTESKRLLSSGGLVNSEDGRTIPVVFMTNHLFGDADMNDRATSTL